MLKQFKPKSKFKRRSIARDIELGMKEAYLKELKLKRVKRVAQYNKRYV